MEKYPQFPYVKDLPGNFSFFLEEAISTLQIGQSNRPLKLNFMDSLCRAKEEVLSINHYTNDERDALVNYFNLIQNNFINLGSF